MKTLALRTIGVSWSLTAILVAGTSAAAPFSADEVERRMAHGAHLSAVCRVEALLHEALEGEHCNAFFVWVRDEFPQIAPGLRNATPAAMKSLEGYKTNLAHIVETARMIEERAAPATP